jgi:ferritin
MAVVSDKVIKAMNDRIFNEEYSARLYKAMSICLNYKGYGGASVLFEKYSKEEEVHADWAYSYLLDLDIRPTVPALTAPPKEFKDLPTIIQMIYDHELKITEQCNSLAKLSVEEGDYMTLELAQRYLREQVEEIAKVTNLLDQLDAFGTSPEALKLLDNYMGELAK